MDDTRTVEERAARVLELSKKKTTRERSGAGNMYGPRTELVGAPPSTPGYQLLMKLFETGVARGKQMQEIADELEISRSTLSHLRTGRRLATQLDSEIISRMAKWLDMPPLAVMMLAEQVTLEDFYSQTDDLSENIERAVNFIKQDSEWGSLMPRQIDTWDAEAKLWMIWCYERATQTKLIGGGVDYIDLLEQLKEFRSEHPMDEE